MWRRICFQNCIELILFCFCINRLDNSGKGDDKYDDRMQKLQGYSHLSSTLDIYGSSREYVLWSSTSETQWRPAHFSDFQVLLTDTFVAVDAAGPCCTSITLLIFYLQFVCFISLSRGRNFREKFSMQHTAVNWEIQIFVILYQILNHNNPVYIIFLKHRMTHIPDSSATQLLTDFMSFLNLLKLVIILPSFVLNNNNLNSLLVFLSTH
jgi:hypothetical protein